MDPTLTLQLPFVLLGRKELSDPRKYMPKSERPIKCFQDVHKEFRKLCPEIELRLVASSEDATHDAAWRLLPSPQNEDDVLNIDERAKLGKNVWTCPALLQRQGIPINTSENAWRVFTQEASRIFEVLGQINEFHAGIDSIKGEHGEELRPRWWSLITPAQSFLRVTLVPSVRARQFHCDFIKRIFITFAALERELTLLTTPSSLLKYWSFSRFLEYRAIRTLGQEKAELWTKLQDRNWTEKRKGLAYAKEKRKWFGGFDEEDRKSERTKGRRREWWDVIDGMEIEESLQDIKGFMEGGRKLGVEPVFAGSLDVDEDDEVADTNTKVTGLAFQSCNSTLDGGEVVAYMELVAGLVHLAHDFDHTKLGKWLERFRETVNAGPEEQPLFGFEKLLSTLHITGPSQPFFTSHLRTLYPEENDESKLEHKSNTPPRLIDPFYRLNVHITDALSNERAYIPTFIQRYTTANGFHPTPTSKVYALMVADEHEQRKVQDTKARTTKGNEDWLSNVTDKVNVDEAKDREEDLHARAPRSPEGISEEEKVRIREALYR
jgi:hypothetical protein